MRAAGTTLFDFGIGETNPEVPVPDIIKQTIASSTMNEENHYSPAQGDPALLEAISEDLATNFDIPTSVDQLCVCPGPKDAIFKAAMAMCNGRSHRRRFVCFAPIYESFISIPLLVGGEQPLVLSTDPKTFLPDPAELRAALEANDDICCVIVNSPNNPTGAQLEKTPSFVKLIRFPCVCPKPALPKPPSLKENLNKPAVFSQAPSTRRSCSPRLRP